MVTISLEPTFVEVQESVSMVEFNLTVIHPDPLAPFPYQLFMDLETVAGTAGINSVPIHSRDLIHLEFAKQILLNMLHTFSE